MSQPKCTVPAWSEIGSHGVFPVASHDETARFNFLTHLNGHLAANILPGVKKAYDELSREAGAEPKGGAETRQVMANIGIYQTWSSLRRNTMEMRQQNGRSMVFRQLDTLIEKAESFNAGAKTLQLDPSVKVPRYVSAVDIHCMPGCYYTKYTDKDVAVGASYDSGIFVTTAGMLGKYSDGGGQAIVEWLQALAKDGFKPTRILDMGCTIGHNIVPLALAFPDAEIIAIDVGEPVLRYAHARAKSLGANNIIFRQADAETLSDADASFDLILSTMFLHELSSKSLPKILAQTHRLLAPGGKVLHIEQPQYTDAMSNYEKFMRDWDTWNNNEPFWGTMHNIDMVEAITKAGFEHKNISQLKLAASVDTTLFPDAGDSNNKVEDFGRKPLWHAYLASK